MKSDEIPSPKRTPKKQRSISILLQLLLSAVLLGGGVMLAAYYMKTGPEAKQQKREPSPPLVQITEAHHGTHRLIINGMGTVLAAKEINLTPGVGGEIIAISDNMVPGGFFTKGETLVTIDPVDYELAVMRLRSEVAKARNELELEMGNQRIAQKEYEILGQEVSKAEKKLMLREPQLSMQQATLQGIKASLAQAELNLKRTKVKAPFNGVVLSRAVNYGTRVTESTTLARLVGTDEFWLKIAIPTDQLKWITFPGDGQEGSEVQIFLQEKGTNGSTRTGRVIRLAADVEEKGRMATVYVAIKDPLCLLEENQGKANILLGSFVQADIEGTELNSVVPINRDHLRDNDSIWLMTDDNTLEIRHVDIVARTDDRVFIKSGLDNGERLIISGLAAPVPGSPLKLIPNSADQPDIAHTVQDESPAKNGAVAQ
jgi:RND family efflux transporter MFP subunit